MCLGIAVDNLATYMPVGLAVGMCIGAFVDSNNRKKNDDNSNKEDCPAPIY